jgi:pimeloyl-ACP methyl ester carboxylesterase
MERTEVNGVTLEYEVRGTGEPVLLIHGAHIADAYAPLLAEPALGSRYRLIAYHRRGFAGSSRAPTPFSIAEQAADAAAVLRHLNVDQAHVVGHSSGGAIALQLALDAPAVVHSLVVLEPALLMVPSGEQFGAAVAPVVAAYEAGDKAAAVDGFLRTALENPNYRSTIDPVLPAGWFEQVMADADTFFQVELPSVGAWPFDEAAARRITQPVLAVLGAESGPLFIEGHALVRRWIPQAESFVLPGATHTLQMQNPRGMAEALAGFFARHPLPVPA